MLDSIRVRPGILALLGSAALIGGGARAESYDCVANPAATLKIGSPVATTLASVEVERGDPVRRGQVIARLEAGVEEADLVLATARAENSAELDSRRIKQDAALVELNRGLSLLPNNTIAAQKVDELRTGYRTAQKDLALAELNRRIAALDLQRARALLEQRVIRSPIDGLVTQRLLGPGEYVYQDSPIMVLAAISPLRVEVYPPIRAWDQVKPGSTASVDLTEPPGTVRSAVVTVVDRVFDPASGTFGVRLELANPDGTLPAGQRCRVTFAGGDAPPKH